MFKLLLLPAVTLGLSAGMARADVVYSITNPNTSTLTSANSTTAQADRIWNFTTLPGWDPDLGFISMTVTETFNTDTNSKSFQATIINFDDAITTAPEIFFLQPQQTTAQPLTRTFTTGCCTDVHSDTFSLADISGDGVLGEFHTRIGLDSGSPLTLESMTITLDFLAPEPATFGMIGLGLAALGFAARRRKFAR
jgi:hypothetical protein